MDSKVRIAKTLAGGCSSVICLAMRRRKPRSTSVAAALVMAATTVFVFWALQDYGPESTIRRFHLAAVNGNLNELQAVTQQNVYSDSVAILAQRVYLFEQAGASYTVARMDRRPLDVRAATVYQFPDRSRSLMIWVVKKDRHTWKVDADRTLTIFRDALGL